MNKKFKNKILSGVLAALMILTMVPVNALEAGTQTTETIEAVTSEVEIQSSEDVSAEGIIEEATPSEATSTETSELTQEESSGSVVSEGPQTKSEEISSTEEKTSTEISEETTADSKTTESEETIEEEQVRSINRDVNGLNIPQETLDKMDLDPDLDITNWEIELGIKDNTSHANPVVTELVWNSERYDDANNISYQITYRNDSTNVAYEPGTFKIIIPDAHKYLAPEDYQKNPVYSKVEKLIAADKLTDTDKQYDWSYEIIDDYIVFSNNNEIGESESLEGTIVITYSMPSQEAQNGTDFSIAASINNAIPSNTANYQITTTEWPYTLTIAPTKLSYSERYSDDYVYVLYNYTVATAPTGVRIAPDDTFEFDIPMEEGAIIYDAFLTEIQPLENGRYILPQTDDYESQTGYSEHHTYSFIMAYPKEDYETAVITVESSVYGNYSTIGTYKDADLLEDETKLLATKSRQVNLVDYVFDYNSDVGGRVFVYNSQWSPQDGSEKIDYDGLRNYDEMAEFELLAETSGIDNCNIKVGIDYYMAQTENDENAFLTEDEYYYREVEVSKIYDQNGIQYQNGTIDGELYIRLKGEDDFILYKTFKNGSQTFRFYNDSSVSGKVVDAYVIYKGLTNGFKDKSTNEGYQVAIVCHKRDIELDTSFFAFGYLQVLDDDGNVLNTPDITSYSGSTVEFGLPQRDMQIYGTYMQRDMTWKPVKNLKARLSTSIQINDRAMKQDPLNEKFTTFMSFYACPYCEAESTIPARLNGFRLYLLLGEGMKFDADVDDLNISTGSSWRDVKVNGESFSTSDEYCEYFKSHMTGRIVGNAYDYNTNQYTNRQLLELTFDFTDNPLDTSALKQTLGRLHYGSYLFWVSYVPVSVSYDEYMTYGSNYRSTVMVYPLEGDTSIFGYADTSDYNKNGDKTELYCKTENGLNTISSAFSTNQEVKITVLTNHTDNTYVNATKTAAVADANTEYIYKVRARTGANNVSNLYLYDNIEVNDKPESWHGTFNGIDMSFANGKTYLVYLPNDSHANSEGYVSETVIVKPYYSENEVTESLYDDNGNLNPEWHEYIEGETDKSLVKSLVFEFLTDSLDGGRQNAIIPENSLTYVLIKMIAPSNFDIESIAYNKAYTEWNAIDGTTFLPVQTITGISSRYAKVSLHEVKTVEGQKIWRGDSENTRPDSITVNLYRNGELFKTTTTSAEENWQYAFEDVFVYDENNEEFNYSVEEEPVANYVASYGKNTNGLAITFGNFATENYSLDNLTIYYIIDGNMYQYKGSGYNGIMGGTGSYAPANTTIQIPSKDVYFVWHTNASGNNYYGFRVNSIVDAEVSTTGLSLGTLPEGTVVEVPQDGTIESSHNPYNNSEDIIYHYKYVGLTNEQDERTDGLYDIMNTYNLQDIDGEKVWIGDDESKRPESITIKLYQNGVDTGKTVTTDASKDWKYTFENVEILDSSKTAYEYSVEELPVDRYITQYVDQIVSADNVGVAITFDSSFKTEGTSDYLEIYYRLNGNLYKMTEGSTSNGKYGNTSLAGRTLIVPSQDVYFYWHTDGSIVYYGFKVTDIQTVAADVPESQTTASLPNYSVVELANSNYPETGHDYTNGENKIWHYVDTGSLQGEMSDTPQSGYFTIVNTYDPPKKADIKFTKIIQGSNEAWDTLGLDKNATYNFKIKMINTETGEVIQGVLTNKGELIFRNIPLGTYTVVETDDNYFNFVSMIGATEMSGITFDGTTLTVGEGIEENSLFEITVTNELESTCYHEDKEQKVNLIAVIMPADEQTYR